MSEDFIKIGPWKLTEDEIEKIIWRWFCVVDAALNFKQEQKRKKSYKTIDLVDFWGTLSDMDMLMVELENILYEDGTKSIHKKLKKKHEEMWKEEQTHK